MKTIESNNEVFAQKMMYGTVYVGVDEMPFDLVERIGVPPDYGEPHRYQIIHVARGDKMYEYQEDLGLASDFTAPEFRFLTLYCHTTQELREMADIERLGEDYWAKRVKELQAESTLIYDAVEQREENHKYIHNRSVFGRGGQTARNGFPSDYTNR